MPTPHKLHDVVIAGAGPVGLFLACELRLAGCTVLVLERMQDPHAPLKGQPFGIRGLSVPTIESFDRRGLLDALKDRAIGRDTPAAAHWMRQARAPGGHFAGIQFFQDQVDRTQWPFRRPDTISPFASDMENIEAVLADRARDLGAEIHRGCGVESFEQSDAGVAVRAGGETIAARWLVGCDGGRSTVRKMAGIAFTGTEPEFTGYSVQVRLSDPTALPLGRHYTAAGMYTHAAPGTVAMVDFDGGAYHRTDPIQRAHVEAVLRKVSGLDVSVDALELAATWTDRAHLATDYRCGRVLLAGDAAHVHSPLGGQGLNLGLGDAMNLGWKLAATIRGASPPGLLDSYADERRPIAAKVLDWSRAQVALMRPSASSRALEAIIRDLIATRDGATYFAERIWGVGLRYPLGGTHPLVGRSVPDIALGHDARVASLLRSGRGLLLDFAARPSLRAFAAGWRDRIDYVASEVEDSLGVHAMLVRPDGIVAWVHDGPEDEPRLPAIATRWFGSSLDVGNFPTY